MLVKRKTPKLFEYIIDKDILYYQFKTKIQSYSCLKLDERIKFPDILYKLKKSNQRVDFQILFHVNFHRNITFSFHVNPKLPKSHEIRSTIIDQIKSQTTNNVEILETNELEKQFLFFLKNSQEHAYKLQLYPLILFPYDKSYTLHFYRLKIKFSKITEDSMEQLFRFLQSSKLQVYFSFRSLNQKYLYLSCNSISDSHDTNQKLADFMKAIKIDLYIRSKPLYISDFIKLFQKKLLSPIQFLKYEEILRFFPFKHELPQGMSKDSKSSVILHIQDLGFFEMDSDIYASNGSHCKLLIFLKLDLQKLQEFLD